MRDHPLSPKPRGAATILVVDDDALMRTLIRRTLTAAGYSVFTAPGVPEARLLLPSIERSLDVLLADVVMPGGLGPELVGTILSVGRDTRVVYMSSYPVDKLKAHGVELGGAGFLQKPFMPNQLVDRIRELV
jgi:two-component system, cell cycle sensor histidine kinase and response regulator CckA